MCTVTECCIIICSLSDATVMVVWFQEKGKAVVDQHVYHLEQQKVMPIRMAKEKRMAKNWAFFFYALETLDVIAASGNNHLMHFLLFFVLVLLLCVM